MNLGAAMDEMLSFLPKNKNTNSVSATESNQARQSNVEYIVNDASSFIPLDAVDVSMIYTRFVLRALNESAQRWVLEQARKALRTNAYLCIETRSINDPLCGDGGRVDGEKNAWISSKNPHHR